MGGLGGAGGIGGVGGIGGAGGWDAGKWGGNSVWGNGNNININNNFRHNNNFGGNPNCWGGHPWWGAGNCHGWHCGHWGHGWGGAYYHNSWWWDDDDDFGKGFMWGMAAWSLGSTIYNMGYQSYSNPYPAPPVQNTTVVYTQPLSVSGGNSAPPADEKAYNASTEKAEDLVEKSRAAFKTGDYTTALRLADESIAATPDDVSLHEYRALCFFALGRYGDAAGVLNPVLASGPGWSWETMIGFYSGTSTYEGQLRKLEAWVKGSPDKGEGHFLLGYQYLVCGHMEKAYGEFDKAAKLQPADSTARGLRDLTKSSLPDDGDPDGAPPPRPDPVPKDKLVGTWTTDASGGKITFKMQADDKFTWTFNGDGKTHDMTGTWGLNDKGLLIMNANNSQMVTAISMEGEKLKFVIIGGPEGDPGLTFSKG